MVANGHERAAAFTVEMLTQRWADLLFGHAQRRFRETERNFAPPGLTTLRRPSRGGSSVSGRDRFRSAMVADAADLLIHGKLRPWFGQTRSGRLRRGP